MTPQQLDEVIQFVYEFVVDELSPEQLSELLGPDALRMFTILRRRLNIYVNNPCTYSNELFVALSPTVAQRTRDGSYLGSLSMTKEDE